MQTWTQIYDPLASLGSALPQYLLSAIVAGIPLYILFPDYAQCSANLKSL
jgi:hypothetical protein